MKARTTEACGRLLFYCSQFGAYILPDRCDGERRIAHGEISKRRASTSRRGRRWIEVSAEEKQDLEAIVVQRRGCLACPGVCKRSLDEMREGKLS